MLMIGLTGPSGAGKGMVAKAFAPYGIPSIDTDKVYHDLLIPPSPCLDELVENFGRGILNPDGSLCRPALSAIVFAQGHEQDLLNLNTITHKYVLAVTRDICKDLESHGYPAVLVDAPLLFESGFDRECDMTLAVLADPDIRLCRIMARDMLSLAQAKARLAAQKPDDFYTSRATHIMYNNGDLSDMAPMVQALALSWGGECGE